MGNDLAIFEKQLDDRMPVLANILTTTPGLPAVAFRAAMLDAFVNNPSLGQCSMPSLMNCASTASCLGLMPQGVTGQFYMIPFKCKGIKVAQPVIGYRGYNSLAARAGYTVNGNVVREGDDFEFQEGTHGHIKHRWKLDTGRQKKRIIGAWAQAEAAGRPPIIAVLDIDQLMEAKKRGGKVWGSDFEAMCTKTPKRRLARNMPLNTYQQAACMEEHAEMGEATYIHPDHGVMADNEPVNITPQPDDLDLDAVTFPIRKGTETIQCRTIEEWRGKMMMAIEKMTPKALDAFRTVNIDDGIFSQVSSLGFEDIVIEIETAFMAALGE